MQLNNPVQMNDWEIKKFLAVVLAIQLAMLGAIGLDAIGFQIPILRPFIGFIYLTFVPGILILRVLKLHKLGSIETLLYTVGLSLATLMFTGFFVNMTYPFFGISRPISLVPLVITISVIVLILCILSYVRDKDFDDPSFIDVGEVLSPPVLFLCLIPFMAVIGTYLVNFHHNNILLMLMIVVIAFVALLIGFDKFIPVKLYPLAILVMAISLIYHDTLISMYLNKYDVIGEYYFSKLVVIVSKWDWTMSSNNNAMLSTTMFAPMFHHISNLDLTWVFKIIYPLILSLVPLGLYSIFKKRTDEKIAFLSSFFFISLNPFYSVIPSLGKQLVAELFFVLLLMLILNVNIKINAMKKSFLMIIFGTSLIVSHYGTSYLVMVSFIFVLFFLYLTENQTVKGLWKRFYFTFKKEELNIANSLNTKNKNISLNFVLLFISFALMWYMYISSSSIFEDIVHIGDHIANTIFMDFLNPETSRGLYAITGVSPSLLYAVYKVFHLIIQFLIGVGLLKLLLRHKETKFEREYVGFSLYWFIICLFAIAVSYFAVMNQSRLYHLSLIFLAPLSILGSISIFEVIAKFFKVSWTNKSIKRSVNMLAIFFIIYFLFNTGFIFEIAKDHPSSISLSQESSKKYGDSEDVASVAMNMIPEQDVISARWLSMKAKKDEIIYATVGNNEGKHALVYNMIQPQKIYDLAGTTKNMRGGNYTYLSCLNIVEEIGLGFNPKLGCPTFFNMTDVYPFLVDTDKIYTNGGSEILWSP
ncbi:MAG TPA: hypothetical protein DCW46_01155 [Desulfotomaculum sp.]|nr:hypothetical protein [Desulfotomaculum sp.]